jgi:hypothetical protein
MTDGLFLLSTRSRQVQRSAAAASGALHLAHSRRRGYTPQVARPCLPKAASSSREALGAARPAAGAAGRTTDH